MKNKYILSLLVGGLLFAACSKEDPFSGADRGEGRISKTALLLTVKDDAISSTRADKDVNIDDFTVLFFKDGNSQPAAKYKYGDMPDVVTLPVGSYTCTATYGEDRQAEWENPYFLGTSDAFEVNAYEITSKISPIVCTLENIEVTINFDASLRSAMSDDSYVEVKVGDSAALSYGVAEADAKKAGYFKHGSEISLVAVFHGKINGVETVETKSLANVAKGCHYDITFRLHTGGGADGSGDADAGVNVDATVSVTDVVRDVELPDDELLDDSERPKEDQNDPEPPTPGEAPSITGEAPLDIDGVNDVDNLTSCIINIVSHAEDGITGFVCDIESKTLNAEELASVGLSSHLDLINPGEFKAALESLGLINGQVKGAKEYKFNLTMFLKILPADTHKFHLTVTDANGTTTKTLILVSK